MAQRTPRRFTARVAGVPRRVGRLAEGSVDTDRTYGDTIDPASDGRLEVRIPKNSGLKITPRGLVVDPAAGDKNLIKMVPQDDLAATPTVETIATAFNSLLQAHRDTKRMRTI